MPRSNRYHLPGYVRHITERCHRQQFLLKFARDRRAWMRWLFEARKRFGLTVLNYQVTCNHVHVLVYDRGGGEIARSMQLVAGCVGRAYNRRKQRRGAYWEDCYHGTIVDSDRYLARCMSYIDLNMVRAGVVSHPCEWPQSGYREIQNPRERYRIIDRVALCELLGVADADLAALQNEWIDAALAHGASEREPHWTEAVAVGRRQFVRQVRHELGASTRYRSMEESSGLWVLRDAGGVYRRISLAK